VTRQRHALVAAVVAATTLGALTPAAAAPSSGPASTTGPTAATGTTTGGPLSTHTVTLITGDVVQLTTLPGGRHSVAVDAGRSASRGRYVFAEQDGHVQVVPEEAIPYVASGQLDRNLFDVTALVAQGYDDASSKDLPLLLSAGTGTGRATAATRLPATPPGARRGPELRGVGAVAVRESKAQARTFWESLDDDTPGTTEPRLGGGVRRIWLDQKVHATLDQSVPQIGAPAAWAAGHDGQGVKVAVLDTGYDPKHPDLAGRVEESHNFTEDPTVVDGVGHGTHVAATIAGSGAASGGLRRGVAPGARLLVGKVLDHDGLGSDSQVMAGMEWAVQQGARVVNVSLGGWPSDGTDPLSEEVNSLTASSGTLFVIAAGNAGPQPQTLVSPGTATSALTVGAVDKRDQMASFSSRGPRMGDSAIKPDLVAPGVDIVAARAAGTSLGDIVDADYISMSGTSMATPHVTGAAALLAEQHPDWRAEQIKSALVATTDHLDGPALADQGTGRVDVATAVSQQVLPTTSSLAFGRVAWTGASRAAITRTVSYHNDSAEPVTLDLGVDVTDTVGLDPHHTPALTVTPQQLTVPAGQSASATVSLDPDATEPGTYAGYVTAQAAGGPVLRTSVGFTVEGQLYDLRLEVLDRNGAAPGGINPVELWNLATGEMTFAALIGGARTVRVPAGRYAVTAYVHTADAGGFERDTTVMGNPEFTVTGNMTMRFDARTAHEFRLRTDDVTQPERYILAWQRTAGSNSVLTGMILPGWMSPVYATPTKPVHTGTFQFFSRWDLDAVPLTARVSGRDGYPLPPPQPIDLTPRLDGKVRLDLVDAGTGSAEDFAHLDARGKAVLVKRHVTGEFDDTYQQLQNAAAAGARALFLYNDRPGRFFAGAGGSPIAGYTLEQQDGQRLLDRLASGRRVTLDLDGVAESPFRYDLMLPEPDVVPSDLSYDLGRKNLARIDVDYHAHTDQMQAAESRMAFPPGIDTAFELFRLLPPPLHRTEYLTTGGTQWIHHVIGDTWGDLGHMYSRAHEYQAGQTTSEVWFPAITRPALPAVAPEPERGAPVSRYNDAIRFLMPQHTDGAAEEYGFSDPVSETTELTLARDGRVVARGFSPRAQLDIPDDPGTYQLTMRSVRDQEWHKRWWTTSTATTTTWTFTSARPKAGEYTVLPLLQVDYDLATDMRNQVPARNPGRLGLRVGYQPGYDGGSAGFAATVAVSYDDGQTWRDVVVRARTDGSLAVDLPRAPAGAGFGSLRVTARDRDGNRIEQTIERAYRVAPAR
jgi:subtilisin family serine protease